MLTQEFIEGMVVGGAGVWLISGGWRYVVMAPLWVLNKIGLYSGPQ